MPSSFLSPLCLCLHLLHLRSLILPFLSHSKMSMELFSFPPPSMCVFSGRQQNAAAVYWSCQPPWRRPRGVSKASDLCAACNPLTVLMAFSFWSGESPSRPRQLALPTHPPSSTHPGPLSLFPYLLLSTRSRLFLHNHLFYRFLKAPEGFNYVHRQPL